MAQIEPPALLDNDPALPAKIVYILYIGGLFAGITWLIGAAVAYANIHEAPGWLEGHFRFQIRTWWMGLAIFLISLPLILVFGLGFLLLLFLYLWVLARALTGLRYVARGEPHPRPLTLGFG